MNSNVKDMPKSWQIRRLDEVARIVAGATPKTDEPGYWDGDVFWATPKDLSGLESKLLTDTARKITQKGLTSCAAEVLPPDSVLFSSRAPIGLTAINKMPVATNQGFKSFVPIQSLLDSGYLYHWLRCNRAYLDSLGNGATFKEVSKAVVSRIEIPLPPLAEQKRIASILDKADAIRRKLQQSLRLSDDFLRSVFLDMFGDPVTNPKGLPTKKLGEFGEIVTGNTPSRKIPENFGDDLEWIKSDNINTPSHYLTPASEKLSKIGASRARSAPAGSTLVTCIAGSHDCIGNAAMTNRIVSFNQQINAIIPNPDVDSKFLYAQIIVAKKLIQIASTNSMKGMVSKSAFSSIEFLAPEPDQQAEFGLIFQQYEKLLMDVEQQSKDAAALFFSLQQRAFRGEL
jgi:type I restriction enzyme S subunit